MKISHFTQTHIGLKRKHNEDYAAYSKTKYGHIFIICDGMGGHAKGEVASQLACETAISFLEKKFDLSTEELLQQCIERVNHVVFETSSNSTTLAGMGTTVVLALIKDNKLYCANVGDSRLYFIRQGKIQQITKDHSYAQELLDAGIISIQDYQNHSRKNELTRAIGINQKVNPFISSYPITLENNDYIILCSDGLTSMLTDEKILNTIQKIHPIKKAVNQLIDETNKAGGKDNVSISIIKVEDRSTLKWKWLVGFVLFIIACITLLLVRNDKSNFNYDENTTIPYQQTNKEQLQDSVFELNKENIQTPSPIKSKQLSEIKYDLSCMTSKEDVSAIDIVNLMSTHRDNIISFGTQTITIKEEQEYGKSFFNSYKDKYEIKKNQKLNRILAHLLRNISSNYTYEIYEVNSTSINAFTIGSYIYIHKGMLDFILNDDELAAVIAHEISHNELGHISKKLSIQKTAQVFLGNDLTTLFSNIEQIITTPFNQKDEVLSDLLGVDLMLLSNYRPCSAIDIWLRLAKQESNQNAFDELLRTHPYSSKRANCIRHHLIQNYQRECK